MANSKAYKLPSKEKHPELYKKVGRLFNKNTVKFANAIEKYVRSNLAPKNAEEVLMFLSSQGRNNLKPEQIKENLAELCKEVKVREAEFVLALQGGKLTKEDMCYCNEHSEETPLWKAAKHYNENKPLLTIAEILHDAGEPLTKKDLTTNKKHKKEHEGTGNLIAVAAAHGSIDQVKTIVEMNGEKLTKQDLMVSVSSYEYAKFEHQSIAVAALRNGQFGIVEQILTEEETSLCVKDIYNDIASMGNHFYMNEEKDCLRRILVSPVFKDSSKNIEKMWKQLPDDFKTSTENQKSYKTALKNAASYDLEKKAADDRTQARSAAKALNKGNITAMKAKTVER